MRVVPLVALAIVLLAGCSKPSSPTSPLPSPPHTGDEVIARIASGSAARRVAPGTPETERAFADGREVTIHAMLVPLQVPEEAQAEFDFVVYPIGFEGLGIGTPQCDPCDHFGDGVDFTDFHDHVLEAMPGNAGYSPNRHLFLVLPAYDGDAAHDARITAAYAARLPARSKSAVDALLAAKLADGSALAKKLDVGLAIDAAIVADAAAR